MLYPIATDVNSELYPLGFRPCCLLSVPKAVNSELYSLGFRPCCLLSVPKAGNSVLCMLASDLVVFSLFPRLSALHSGFRPCCLLSVPKAVNSELCTLGFSPVHGPILLGWAMVRHFYLAEEHSNKDAVETHRDTQSSKDAVETHKLGNKALQLGVFKVILDLLGTEPFTGSSVSWFWFA